MSKLSIVIPVYNVEKYLNACVDSVRKQTFNDWELLLVDDGSTDNSYCIASDYTKTDTRIKVVSNTHKGVSAARNLGIELAKSEYIMFVDSDDTIEPYACECLVDAMQGFDFAVSTYKTVYSDGKRVVHNIESFSGSMESFCQTIDSYLGESILQGPCWKVYKRDTILKNRIMFPENMSFGEDAFFVYTYLKCIENINIIARPTYSYYVREQGLNCRFRSDKYEINVMLNRMICDVCNQFGVCDHEKKQNGLNRKAFATFLSDCTVCKEKEKAIHALRKAVSMKETADAFFENDKLTRKQKVMKILLRRKSYRLLLALGRFHKMILKIKVK